MPGVFRCVEVTSLAEIRPVAVLLMPTHPDPATPRARSAGRPFKPAKTTKKSGAVGVRRFSMVPELLTQRHESPLKCTGINTRLRVGARYIKLGSRLS
jgi:hypothetical protein